MSHLGVTWPNRSCVCRWKCVIESVCVPWRQNAAELQQRGWIFGTCRQGSIKASALTSLCVDYHQIKCHWLSQANVASYDWSALLYLSTVGEDFEGVAPGENQGNHGHFLQVRCIRMYMNWVLLICRTQNHSESRLTLWTGQARVCSSKQITGCTILVFTYCFLLFSRCYYFRIVIV